MATFRQRSQLAFYLCASYLQGDSKAIGGSTNAVVHLMAIIGRHPQVAGTIDLDTFDKIGRNTPLLVDLKPTSLTVMPVGGKGATWLHGSSFLICQIEHCSMLQWFSHSVLSEYRWTVPEVPCSWPHLTA